MNIEIGKLYKNKTSGFIVPMLRVYGEPFIHRFKEVYKLAFGIHDTLLDGLKYSKGRNIFILLDSGYKRKSFTLFINWVRNQNYFITDYRAEYSIEKHRKHMLVIKIPVEFNSAYDNFLEGKYSKMYSKEQVKNIFSKKQRKKEYHILVKSKLAKDNYFNKIKEQYGIIPNTNKEHNEYCLPPENSEEIFNYYKRGNNKNKYIDRWYSENNMGI